MKNIIRIFTLISFVALTSCESFLGDNENPNEATSATPELVLPNALVSTASLLYSFNSNAMWINGNTVNAGGYGGFGSVVTYNYTTSTYATLWTSAYDDLVNYHYIETETVDDPSLAYFNAVAKVMKAYDFHMLVDVYGDIPYFEALKGSENVIPVYDSQVVIYQDLVEQLDLAIDIFQNAEGANGLGSGDVMFGGDISEWTKFANTLKLRLLIRMSGAEETSSFATEKFGSFDTGIGFLTDDAMVNPGYIATDGKQNPYWNSFHTTAAGALAGQGRSRIPSIYTFTFYDGTKILDNGRGAATYREFPADTPVGQLGELNDNPTALSNQSAWYVGSGTGSNATNTIGLLKGRTASVPLILASEAYLLQAEAYMKGFLSGDDITAFDNGVKASFQYLYEDITGAISVDLDVAADFNTYQEENAGNYLVNYVLASSPEEKLEAIITQKYIAYNFINAQETWSEFRRTGYPTIINGSTNPERTFASLLSNSTRADELPVRYLYANTEFQLNGSNVPTGINQFTSLIFWQEQ